MVTYYCSNCNIYLEQSECSVCGGRTQADSRLYWCTHCQIPTYDEVCTLCQNHGVYFTSDARPVFPEERLLLELLLHKPLAFVQDSVWNGVGNRYYVNGKKIETTLDALMDYDPNQLRVDLDTYASQNDTTHFEAMIARWITANAQHYHDITTEAKQFITAQATRFINTDASAAFVSFSGGKDSTVVSDLVRKSLGNPSIIHIFGNTTLEFPHTYQYIQRFKKENRKTPMLRTENKEQDFFNLCETFGPPSRTLRWCCTIFKTGFIGEKLRRTFGDEKTILTFYGIRRSESTSRSHYERTSTGKKISKQLVASPIIDWFDHDIWLYLLTTKVDFNDAYRLGYTRVGCWCCPNNSRWAQFLSSIYMPEDSARSDRGFTSFYEGALLQAVIREFTIFA